jgi:ERCC4-type nuclease
MRDGGSIIRRAGVPKPIVIVDTRERQPLPLMERHANWIAGERRTALGTGDYSIEGMEHLLALERKSLADVVNCTVVHRRRFLAACHRLAEFTWKAILVEATFEDIKSGFPQLERDSGVHPNAVTGTLDAIEAKFGIPVIYTSTNRTLATERAASWLSKHFTYWWLESNQLGRVLIDDDKL